MAHRYGRRFAWGAIMDTPISNHAQQQPRVDEVQSQPEDLSRNRRRRRIIGAGTAFVVLCLGLTVWVVRKAEEAKQEAIRKAEAELNQARQAAEKVKKQLEQESAARRKAAIERNQALAAEKEAQRSQQIAQAVVDFLKKHVLTPGPGKSWGEVVSGKEVTLREAVNAAEPKVAKMFADRPLVEASVRQVLGAAFLDLGETEHVIQQYERALALREAELGPDHPATGENRNQLAVAYRRAGRIDDASRLFQQDPLSSSYAASLTIQGAALLAEGKPAEAELKLRGSLAVRQKIQPDDWTTFDAQALLGAALLDQKEYAQAEPLLLSGYEGMKRRQAKIPAQDRYHLTRTLERLVRLYEEWGKPDKAEHWRKEWEAADHPPKH
jgi:tetratricopeptide (TPR) repeat protein